MTPQTVGLTGCGTATAVLSGDFTTLTISNGEIAAGVDCVITFQIEGTAIGDDYPNGPTQITLDTAETDLFTGPDPIPTIDVLADPLSDLSLTKGVFTDAGLTTPVAGPVAPGTTVYYGITLTNAGPTDATGIQVTDVLPVGVTAGAVTPPMGTTYVAPVWDIPALASGANVTLAIPVTVDLAAGSPLVNFAQVTTADQPDPDSTPNNGVPNTPVEDDEASVSFDVDTLDGPTLDKAFSPLI
ncbi:DUF11 domain-containing protein [bacterium]|nr:DUF11 domain-containing protein [bacterium]